MRILVVTNQYAPAVGGIEVLLRQMMPLVLARGHQVEVVTSTNRSAPAEESVVDGVVVHRTELVNALVNRDPGGMVRGRKAAQQIRRRFAPDVVHGHDLGPNLWAVLRDDPGIPVVTTVHCRLDKLGSRERGPNAQLLAASSWLTGVTAAVVSDLVALAPSMAERASVVLNGLPPTEEPAPLDPSSRRIVAAGRFEQRKAFDVLLRAMPAMLAEVPDAVLQLVGDGSLKGELEAIVDDLGIGASVVLLGAVRHDEVADAMAEAAVVAIPSRSEGMPLVALEAAAAGRSVVASAVDGLTDVVVDGETGRLVPPDDPAALAAALVAVLRDPARNAAMGAAARRRAVEHFPLERTVVAYEEVYERVIAEGSSPPGLPVQSVG